MGSAVPQPFKWELWVPSSSMSGMEPTSVVHVVTTAASLRVAHLLRHHLRLGFHLGSSFKKIYRLCNGPRLKGGLWESAFHFKGTNFIQFTNDTFASSCSSCLCFFNGEETRKSSGNEGSSNIKRANSFNGRIWTNILLAINVVIYLAQVATKGKLLLWGAKINSLIDKGQFWRLVTSSLLHGNIVHLMVNCYSLNSFGPIAENISGPQRYLAVYFTSAITSAAMSYQFSKEPSVGASGAIFGLVGSAAVFVMRHRGMNKDAKQDLLRIAEVIFLNMALGLASNRIDNWGHLGGLLGGAAISWLVGPAWKYQSTTSNGRKIFADRAPIFYLTNKIKRY